MNNHIINLFYQNSYDNTKRAFEQKMHPWNQLSKPECVLTAVEECDLISSLPQEPDDIKTAIDSKLIGLDFDNCTFVHLISEDPSTFYLESLQHIVSSRRCKECTRITMDFIIIANSTFQGNFPKIVEFFNLDKSCKAIIIENAVPLVALYIMARCKRGGIVSQSFDSWWGALMIENSQQKQVYMAKSHPLAHKLTNDNTRIRFWHGQGESFTEDEIDSVAINKMRNSPPILWINLARNETRRTHMERLCAQYKLDSRNSRVNAIDYLDVDFPSKVKTHKSGSNAENACVASHMKAMQQFLVDYPDEPYVIVMEDDVSFDLTKYWKKSFTEYLLSMDAIDASWEVIQLSGVIPDRDDVKTFSKFYPIPRIKNNWFGAAAYVMKRNAAERFVKSFINTDTQVVDFGNIPNKCVHADFFIYELTRTYFLPLFTYLAYDSMLHAATNPTNHAICKGYIEEFWKDESLVLE